MSTLANAITAILTNIFSSASKLVFLMIAATLCVGLFTKIISQENFIFLAGNVFSYYFGLTVGTATQPPQPPRDPQALAAGLPPTGMVTSEVKTTSTAPAPIPGVK